VFLKEKKIFYKMMVYLHFRFIQFGSRLVDRK